MSLNMNLPKPDHLPAELGERINAYHRAQRQHFEAEGELQRMKAGADAARVADAQALADAAREGKDLKKVGTPNSDALAADIRRQQPIVDGLRTLVEQLSQECTDLMPRHRDAAIEAVREHSRELMQPYLEAIDAVGKAARAFDATLYQLAGWQVYIASDGKNIGFGDSGSIGINGAWLEPFNVDMLTANLRAHARRYQQLVDAIDKATAAPPALPAGPRTREETLEEDGSMVWGGVA